jgi:AcrR family transcriptional regulator
MTAGNTQRRAVTTAGSEVRRRLIAAACELIAEGGSSAATSRAITDRAGENLASITYYFGSKDALMSEAMAGEARALLQPVLDVLGADREPTGRLLEAVQLLIGIVQGRADRLAVYLDCLAQAARHDRVASEVRGLLRDLQGHLADEMARQRRDGQIPDWVDPPAMASLIVALANGVVAGIVVDPAATDPAAVGHQFASLLLSARTQDGGT